MWAFQLEHTAVKKLTPEVISLLHHDGSHFDATIWSSIVTATFNAASSRKPLLGEAFDRRLFYCLPLNL